MYKYKHASFLKFAVSDSEYFCVINVQILVNTLRSVKLSLKKKGRMMRAGEKYNTSGLCLVGCMH
jgi:hypothetical protein